MSKYLKYSEGDRVRVTTMDFPSGSAVFEHTGDLSGERGTVVEANDSNLYKWDIYDEYDIIVDQDGGYTQELYIKFDDDQYNIDGYWFFMPCSLEMESNSHAILRARTQFKIDKRSM